MRNVIRLVTAFGSMAGMAAAQAVWTPVVGAGLPSPRDGAYLVHDPAWQRTFLMLGRTTGTWGGGTMDPLWSWDGTVWAPATASYSAFFFMLGLGGMCAEGPGSMLMFGGYRPGLTAGMLPAVLDQTWRVQATGASSLVFTLLAPAVHPPARQGPGLVATPLGALLFGGTNVAGNGFFGDTWLWNGSTWLQLAPPSSPPARAFHAMAFDAARNVVVVFGGAGPTGLRNDTWEFDGVDWQQRFPAQQPAARCRAGCAWSPVLGRMVVAGGGSWDFSSSFDDAWTWDGAVWQHLLAPGAVPAARQGAAFAWDPVRQQSLCFSGRAGGGHLQDTWHLDVPTWPPASYTPFGTGCGGPGGLVPALDVVGGGLPRIGSTTQIRVANLPPGLALPVFVLGTSNTFESTPPGHPLPFDLGFLGWPGCRQLVSHDVLDAVPTLTGQATRAFAVPFTATVLGFTFHAQALVLFAPTGAAVSNALTGVVGI